MSTSALNQNVVKTALDAVFFAKFDDFMGPDFGSVRDPMIFAQETSDRAAEIEEVVSTGGYWTEKEEMQDSAASQIRTGNQTTYSHTTFATRYNIGKELFDDDQHSVVRTALQKRAATGRATQEKQGMKTFVNAFNASFLGADGDSLCSTTHTLLGGTTFDNMETAALTPTSLESMIQQFLEMPDEDGVIMGLMPKLLLVPPALFSTATRIVESQLRQGTANNDINYVSTKYPGLVVKQSPYIGAAAGGSDTAFFLLGDFKGTKRFVREAINTRLIPFEYQANDSYVYKARYRESVGWTSPIGIIGSNGTT